MSRFITQSFVLLVMDALWLLVYLLFYKDSQAFSPGHTHVVLTKMAIMLGSFLFFGRIDNRGYNPECFLCRNVDIIYPTIHMFFESLLFISGPQDFGALLRFIAVPFIAGGIPIVRQDRAFALLFAGYAFGWHYLRSHTVYSVYITIQGFLVNYWAVVFTCSLLVSFTVYSWSVNAFLTSLKEKQAQQKLSELNEHLSHLSQQDSLTGLLNRRGFQKLMDERWQQHSLHPSSCTITAMMFDIDYFKRYNDRFGHLEGDDCLATVTAEISKGLADGCIVARYGGEEFLAIAYDTDHDQLMQRCLDIKENILALKIENPGSEISPYVTISIGIATHYLADVDNYSMLIESADQAMYFAKNNGRNQLVQTRFRQDSYLDANGTPLEFGDDTEHIVQEFDEEYMQRVLMDISADCTFIYDGRRRSLEFSDSAVQLYHTPRNVLNPEMHNLAGYINVAPEDVKYFNAEMRKALNNQEQFLKLDLHIRMPNHSSLLVAIRAQCSFNKEGRLELLFGSVYSIQKILEYNQYLREQSMTYSITLLPNRRQLNKDLKALLKKGEGSGHLVLIDINNFREVNSMYSHNIGDKVLYETARHLSKLSRNATVYSYNVDQYIILLHRSDQDDARQLMHDISQYFHSDFQLIEGMDLHVDFTMLAVEYDCYATILDDLFVDLDIAIQYAKYHRPSGFFFLTDEVRNTFLARVGLSNALKRAVENDFEGFMLYYQPIFDGEGLHCMGAEALLRWRDGDSSVLSPNVIIPELERAALMPAVEQWVFNTACRQCAEWIDQGAGEDFFMHINLSSASIGRPGLLEDVCSAISGNGLDRKNVVFEAIETSAILEMKTAVHSLTALKDKGIRIAIDDFGTGYSSLSYLSSLPADEIKIDRYFLNNIDKSPSDREFLYSIIGLAKSMGFLVCIEGVETIGQFHALKHLRMDYLQGFYLGRPASSSAFYRDYIAHRYNDYPSAITSL